MGMHSPVTRHPENHRMCYLLLKKPVGIGLTGNRGGPMRDLCDYLLEMPSCDTPKIQEGHLVLGHIVCGLVENAIFKAAN